MQNASAVDDFQVNLDLLARAFPARLGLRLDEATGAVSMSVAWWHGLASQGKPPFPAHLEGNKRVVRLVDLARFMAGRAAPAASAVSAEAAIAAPAAPRLDEVAGEPRHGRPTRGEEARARELGFGTVAAYRAAQRAKLVAAEVKK